MGVHSYICIYTHTYLEHKIIATRKAKVLLGIAASSSLKVGMHFLLSHTFSIKYFSRLITVWLADNAFDYDIFLGLEHVSHPIMS